MEATENAQPNLELLQLKAAQRDAWEPLIRELAVCLGFAEHGNPFTVDDLRLALERATITPAVTNG